MVVTHARSKRKATGGRYTSTNPKRKHHTGRHAVLARLDENETRTKTTRAKGGGHKRHLLLAQQANLLDPKTKKTSVVDIEGVTQNPASRHFVRRNILTKGTIIETAKGPARITNRPGQDGTINATLTQE